MKGCQKMTTNNNFINNTIVDGTINNIVSMKEQGLCMASQPTGEVSVDTILEYGRREMKRTGKNWFIFDMPVSLIQIDNDYQRRVSDETVRKILKNYDPNRVDVKLVNFRFDNRRRDGGRFFVLDGQHTLTVERELGHEALTCKVFIGLNKKEEAKLFATQNEFRRGITSYAKFRAEVVAGMAPAVEIDNLIKKYGFEIKENSGVLTAGSIISVRKLYSIVKKYGIEGLDFTFQTIIELGWDTFDNGLNEKVLCLSAAYEFCKGNPRNYAILKSCLETYESPSLFVLDAANKFINETQTQTRAVERFVRALF